MQYLRHQDNHTAAQQQTNFVEAAPFITDSYRDYSRVPTSSAVGTDAASLFPTRIVDMSFPQRIYHLLNNTTEFTHQAIRWCEHGRAFRIVDPLLLEGMDLLPKYFGHDRYWQLVVDLTLYGFKRIGKGIDNGCFYHQCMLRGLPHLCKYVVSQPVSQIQNTPEKVIEPDFYQLAQTSPLPDRTHHLTSNQETSSKPVSDTSSDSQHSAYEALLLLSQQAELRSTDTVSPNQSINISLHQPRQRSDLTNLKHDQALQTLAAQLMVSPSLRNALRIETNDIFKGMDGNRNTTLRGMTEVVENNGKSQPPGTLLATKQRRGAKRSQSVEADCNESDVGASPSEYLRPGLAMGTPKSSDNNDTSVPLVDISCLNNNQTVAAALSSMSTTIDDDPNDQIKLIQDAIINSQRRQQQLDEQANTLASLVSMIRQQISPQQANESTNIGGVIQTLNGLPESNLLQLLLQHGIGAQQQQVETNNDTIPSQQLTEAQIRQLILFLQMQNSSS